MSMPVRVCVQWGTVPSDEDGWPTWWNEDIIEPEEFGFRVHMYDNGSSDYNHNNVTAMFQNKKPQPDLLCWKGHDAWSSCDLGGTIAGIDKAGNNLGVFFWTNNPGIGWPNFAMSQKNDYDNADTHKFEANEDHIWEFQGVKFRVKREVDDEDAKKFNVYINWTG